MRVRHMCERTSSPSPLHIVYGAAVQPHPAKADTGGEDALFADDLSGTFGVADGVGGSKGRGADPGLFSRALLRYCRDHFCRGEEYNDGSNLRNAVEAAASGFAKNRMGGSSTFILGKFESSGALHLLNLGDSGAILFRPARRKFKAGTFLWPRIVISSQDQSHYFNCPYQVSSDEFRNAIDEADELQVLSRHGDVLVAASDGVLDNLFTERIQGHIAQFARDLLSADGLSAQRAVDECARVIADEALAVGLRQDDEAVRTPFQMAAAHEGYAFAGGKLDDVAVVVGVIRESDDRPAARSLHNLRAEHET